MEGEKGTPPDRGDPAPDSLATGVGLDNRADAFPSTHWSLLLDPRAEEGAGDFPAGQLEQVCRRYWYPLYAYLRRRGFSSPDAQDLTQGFFAKLLTGSGLSGVDRNRGRFRSYMIGAMNHHLLNERDKDRADKRGGGQQILSIDEELAEQRFQNEPVDDLSPEKLFDREWALALLQDVHERLGREFTRKGRQEVFSVLGEYLIEKPEKGTYPVLAERLGVSAGNVRVMVTRTRKRYQELLRETIAETVGSADEVEGELTHLLEAFSVV